MMPGLQDGDTAAFLRVLPQDSGVHTRWLSYPKDGGVGVFSYKMSVLPTRWRRAYKMAALPKRWWLYPQDGGIPTKWQCFCEFYHKMAACIQDGGIIQKMAAWEFFSYKMSALPTRWRRGSFAYKMAALRTRWWLYTQDGGVPTK